MFSLVEIRRKDSRHWGGKPYMTVKFAFLRDFIDAFKAQRLASY